MVIAGAATLVAAAVLAAIVTSSGGGAGGPPVREYLTAVEKICAEYGARLDEIRPPTDLSSPGAVVESLQQALPVLVEQRDEVRALEEPGSLRGKLARFFELTDRSLAELRRALAAAMERALYPMAVALTDFGEVRDEAKVVAREIGFHC
jgi:hypothetical protein